MVATLRKKFIIGALVIIVAILAIVFFVFWKASKPEMDMRKEAEALAYDLHRISVIEDSYAYNGNKPYITVVGLDEYGEEKAVFVPVTLDEEAIKEVYLKDGITKSEAIQILSNDANVKEILHTKLGYDEAGPVWEIVYKAKNDTLNYVYVFFEDGQWWKRILNL